MGAMPKTPTTHTMNVKNIKIESRSSLVNGDSNTGGQHPTTPPVFGGQHRQQHQWGGHGSFNAYSNQRPPSAPFGGHSQSAPFGGHSQSAPFGAYSQSAPFGAYSQSAPFGAYSQQSRYGNSFAPYLNVDPRANGNYRLPVLIESQSSLPSAFSVNNNGYSGF